ncbi:MAG: O-antigen ligase family protein [Candidatus Methylomirabilis sp.]
MLPRSSISRKGEEDRVFFYADAVFMGGLALMILTLPLSEALKNIGYFVALGGWLLKRAARRDFRMTFTPIGVFLSTYFLISLLSAAFAFDRWEGFRGAWDVFRFLSVFLMMINDVDSKPKIIFCVSFFVASTGISVAWGLINYFSGAQLRIGGKSLGSPPDMATYLVIMFVLLISLLLVVEWSMRTKMAVVAIASATYLAIFLTYSRGGWIACLAILVFLSVSLKRWEPILIPAVLTMAILLGLNMSGRLWTWHFETLPYLTETDSFKDRIDIWKGSIQSFQERPLLGVGPRNFKNLDYERYGFKRTKHAHSVYLNVLAERGLVGLLSLMAFFVSYVYECMRRRHSKDALNQALWYAAVGALITIVVAGMVSTTLHSEVAIAFSSVTALMLASSEAAQP